MRELEAEFRLRASSCLDAKSYYKYYIVLEVSSMKKQTPAPTKEEIPKKEEPKVEAKRNAQSKESKPQQPTK